ncbi:MAG: cysteine desulfurase [Maricaulaceae bacterium]|nr:cysteine desulfurase [Maricaulaceae bacterium]
MNAPVKAPALDIAAIRAQFPILKRQINGHPLVYLDSAASAQKPDSVIDAVSNVYRQSYANVHRGLHTLANEATTAFEAARETVANFLNVARPEEIVFTRGATEAVNLVAFSLGESLGEGDAIIISQMEHHSNIVPWLLLAERKGAVVRWARVTDDGALDMAHLESLIGQRTKLLAITHMSNVLGTVNDARAITEMAHAKGVPVLFDGAQAAVHLPVDVRAIGCDFYVFTGHKLYGPSGAGALYAKGDWLERLGPWQGGGEMIADVYEDRVTFADVPHKFEAGTPAIADVIGMAAAIKWLSQFDKNAIMAHEAALYGQAAAGLRDIPGARIIGTAPGKGAILSFSVDGLHAHDLAQIMDRYGVAVRAGHHCAQPLMRRFGVTSTARASFAIYNTPADAGAFIAAVAKAREFLI